jgi:hypothetical protein
MTTEKDPNEFTDEEVREARKNLNPIEDVKGAIRYLKDMDPVEEVKEFMETAAEVLDPRQSDVRVIRPEEDEESEPDEPEK